MNTKLFRALILIFIIYLLLELTSFIAFFIINRRLFSLQDTIEKRDRIILDVQVIGDLKVAGLNVPWNVPIHPFYGFGKPSGFDFLTTDNHDVQNDPNGVVVAITGGSVAFNLLH